MMWNWGNGGWGGFGGFGGWWFMPIIMIVVLGLIIWGVVAFARGISREGWGSRSSSELSPDSALEILKRRYSRGEINKEEFEQKKKDLV